MDMAAAARYSMAEMTYVDPAIAAHRERVIAGIRKTKKQMHCEACDLTVFVGGTIPWWPDNQGTPAFKCGICKGTMIAIARVHHSRERYPQES